MMRTKYSVKYAYTLYEIMSNGLSYLSYGNYPKASNKTLARSTFNVLCGVVMPTTDEIPEKYVDKENYDLLNLILERYWNEYVFESEEEYVTGEALSGYPDILYQTRLFVSKLFNLIRFTYPKYSVLLKAYEDEANSLTAKLEKITDGTATTRNNDTPQDGGDFDDDEHTSFISQGKVDNTESWDNESMIERLDKVNRLFAKVKEDWLNEFKDLFIEGGNYL